jgi:hypothetical protein
MKCIFIAAAALVLGVGANATTITATGTNPASSHNLSAAADFNFSGSQLILTLTNNNPAGVPSDILTGIFFDLSGNPSLTYVSGVTASGSCTTGHTCPPAVDVKSINEWVFAQSLSSPLNGITEHYGVGTAGFGILSTGGGQQFNYGLVNGLVNPNNPVANGTLIDDSVKLTFNLAPGLYTVSNVRFQYGTSLDEPSLTGRATVPEPGTIMTLSTGFGMLATGLWFRRRKRS